MHAGLVTSLFEDIVNFLKREGIAIVEVGKESGFVLMPQGMFDAKNLRGDTEEF